MKNTQYKYETEITANEISIIAQTKLEVAIHNSFAEECYYDKSTFTEYFQMEKQSILKKCGIAEKSVDDERIHILLACEAIKAQLEDTESHSDWTFLKATGIVDIDIDLGYPRISIAHQNLGGSCNISIGRNI